MDLVVLDIYLYLWGWAMVDEDVDGRWRVAIGGWMVGGDGVGELWVAELGEGRMEDGRGRMEMDGFNGRVDGGVDGRWRGGEKKVDGRDKTTGARVEDGGVPQCGKREDGG